MLTQGRPILVAAVVLASLHLVCFIATAALSAAARIKLRAAGTWAVPEAQVLPMVVPKPVEPLPQVGGGACEIAFGYDPYVKPIRY